MAILKQSTAYVRLFLMVLTSDHITGATSKTVTVNLSKGGQAFSAAAGAVAEVGGAGNGNGWYSVSLTNVDTNMSGATVPGDLSYHCTASGCDPTDFVDQVQTTVFTDLLIDGTGRVFIASSIKQNAVLNGFTFVMTNSTTHQPQTGLTVTAQRALGGAGFGACANAVSELSNGVYTINLAATDTNSPTVLLRFTAVAADDLDILLVTQP